MANKHSSYDLKQMQAVPLKQSNSEIEVEYEDEDWT